MNKNYKVVELDKQEEYIKKFLKLPKKLYSKKELMQKRRWRLQIVHTCLRRGISYFQETQRK